MENKNQKSLHVNLFSWLVSIPNSVLGNIKKKKKKWQDPPIHKNKSLM